MKKIYLYSLMMLLATSSVVFSSCSKDDDKDEKKEVNQEQNQNSNQEQNQNSNQEQNQEQTVEKFTVTIDLNGEKIELGTSEVGQKITVDFDEVVKRSEFDGYEVLSITKDGVEVSGKQEVSANAEYKVEAIKCCSLSDEIPAKNKVLYGVNVNEYQSSYFWIYSYKTYYKYVYKIGSSANNTFYEISKKDKGLLIDYYERETDLNSHYLLKNDSKYYVFSKRYTKKDQTVKGYKTEWIANTKISKDAIVEDNTSIVINESAKYEAGIITTDEHSYAYDGTYLYEIYSELEEKDAPTYSTGKSPVTLEESGLTVEDLGLNPDYYTVTKDNAKVNVYKSNYADIRFSYFALYDWNNDGEITPSEVKNTWVVNTENDTYYAVGNSISGNCGILPDQTYMIYGYHGKLNDKNSFKYNNWVVFYFDIEAARNEQ